jgi:hypothetical protein
MGLDLIFCAWSAIATGFSLPNLITRQTHPLTSSWIAEFMKTTMDLPEDLNREIKLRAARERRKLRDVAVEVLR